MLSDGAKSLQAKNTRIRAEKQLYRDAETERVRKADFDSIVFQNDAIKDGRVTDVEVAESEANDAATGIPNYESPGTRELKKQKDSVRYESFFRADFTKKADNNTLTFEDLNQAGVSHKLRQEFLPALEKQNLITQSPEYKSGVEAIKGVITGHRAVVAGRGTGNRDHWTTNQLVNQEIQEFKKQAILLGDPSQLSTLSSGRMQIIQSKQETPGYIDKNGHYTSLIAETKQQAKDYQAIQLEDSRFIEGRLNVKFNKDPYFAVNVYGQKEFYEAYYPMQRGEVIPQLRRRSAQMGMSPLAAINFLAGGLSQPAIAQDAAIQNLMEKVAPLNRLINVYRTDDRLNQADHILNNTVSEAPTRGKFNSIQRKGYDNFIEMAKTSGAKFPELVAAQWALESSYGASPSGQNNFFGAKATSAESSTAKQTKEFVNGQEVSTAANFKNYSTPQAAVDELVNRWYKDYDRFSGVNNANSLEEAAMMLQQQNYATDPRYADKLLTIVNSFRN